MGAQSCKQSATREHPKKALQDNSIPAITILGNGSNVLISDSGIRGIVIKNTSSNIKILPISPTPQRTNTSAHHLSTRHAEYHPKQYLSLKNKDYDESSYPRVLVQLDAGTPLPCAIDYLIKKGITGLQWFAYIPSQIGGAIWYNIHGGNHHISEYIYKITLYNQRTQKLETIPAPKIKWNYDTSPFQSKPHLVILSVTLKLYKGNTTKAKNIIKEWITQKSKVQPTNSAGSAFKNLPEKITTPIWGQHKPTGWIIDQQLKLKGKQIGGAKISKKHANFIVNTGNATAKDYLKLAKRVQQQFKKHWNINLPLEIKLLGKFN